MLQGSPSTVSGDPAVHPAARHNIVITILVVTTGSAGGISAEKSGLELGPCFERVQAVAAAKGGWPVCDPLLRLAGAAIGGS